MAHPLAKLTTIRPRIGTMSASRISTYRTSEKRITGRALQERRLNIWKRKPYCASCGRLVEYPHGFELDHIVALTNGGKDIESNCQVLCVDYVVKAGEYSKVGCHASKTKEDLAYL
jgi:5-methylcytosine-specific restriction protein A